MLIAGKVVAQTQPAKALAAHLRDAIENTAMAISTAGTSAIRIAKNQSIGPARASSPANVHFGVRRVQTKSQIQIQ